MADTLKDLAAANATGDSFEKQRWVEIQKKTFTRWANTYLVGRSLHIDDIAKDLHDGIVLWNLLELISDKKLPPINKKPRLRAQILENTMLCLKFLTEQNLKLVGIGSDDIVDGNLKLILGLIWTIILRYQIQKGRDEVAKNALLEWVRSKIPEYHINDFTNSWADGMAICALCNALVPNCVDMTKRDPSKALENAAVGTETAEKDMQIPRIFSAEDMVSASDALSMMTYISYFRDYDDKMQKLRDTEASRRAAELYERTCDPTKSHAIGDGLTSGEVNIPSQFKIIAKNGASRQCPCGGVNWVVTVTAPDGSTLAPADINVEDNNDGSYNVRYVPRKAGPNKVAITLNDVHIIKSPYTVQISPPIPDPSKCRAFGPGVEGCQAGGPTNFQIQACNRLGDPITVGGHPFKADVKGHFGEDLAPRMVDNNDGTYTVTYVPSPTTDVVAVTINGKHIANSPFQVPVAPDPHAAFSGLSYAYGPGVEGPCNTFDPCVFTIQAVSPTGEKLAKGGDIFTVDVYDAHDDQVSNVSLKDNGDGTYAVSYHAPRPGKHRVEVALHHSVVPLYWSHIKDSPFRVEVAPGIDPSKCTAFGPGLGNDVSDTQPTYFTVQSKDCEGKDLNKGGYPFEVKVTGPKGDVPATVTDNGDGTYKVDYAPTDKGDHIINVMLEGKPVAESPYTVHVKAGADSDHTCIDSFSFTIIARNKKGELHKKGGDPFKIDIAGPGKPEPKLADNGDGSYTVKYSLPEPGTYQVSVTLHGKHIQSSPWEQSY